MAGQDEESNVLSLERPLLEELADSSSCEESVPPDGARDAPGGQFSSSRGVFLLLFVAFLYGTLNVSLRLVYSLPDPPSASVLSVIRGWMGSLFFLPFLLRRKPPMNTEESSPAQPLWMAAGELAIWGFASQGLINLGLLTVSSARSSFLGQTSVVMTPLIAALAGEQLTCCVGLGCLLSMAGLVFLSIEGDDSDDSSSLTASGLSFGDLLILLSSFCWSVYVVRTSALAKFYDEVQLQARKTFFQGILYSIWFIISSMRAGTSLWLGWSDPFVWMILAYSALGPGTVADMMQQEGQKSLASTQSNLILCTEPVFTSLLAQLILREDTSMFEYIGGGFLMLGALVSSR